MPHLYYRWTRSTRMLTYTPVSEAGGVGKTTLAATLAASHSRAGRRVLAIDLDARNGGLTHLLGVDYDRTDSEVDTLVNHLVGRPAGDFEELVREVEHGIDLVPAHNVLEDLQRLLLEAQMEAREQGEAYDPYRQLHRVLRDADVGDEYDVLVVDTSGVAGPILYNALVAVRNVVVPVEATAKGLVSIGGLDDIADGLEERLDVEVGLLAVVPIRYRDSNDQREILATLRERGFEIPIVIGERSALLEGCWNEQCTPYTYVEEHRDRQRDYELETLAQFDELARYLERKAGLDTREVAA